MLPARAITPRLPGLVVLLVGVQRGGAERASTLGAVLKGRQGVTCTRSACVPEARGGTEAIRVGNM